MTELIEDSNMIGFIILENLFLINVVAWYFMWISKGKREKKQDYDFLEMMNQYYEQNLDSIKERYDQIRIIKHDMRNTLLVLDNLIKENRIEEACDFLDGQVERIDKIQQVVTTDNHFVNAILNQKLSEAKEKNIEVRCIILTSFCGIENRDICNLFGNLLDNAIEANENVTEGAWLELVLEGDKKELEIICRNSTVGGITVRQNKLPITKKDRRWHGYGGRIIEEIVKRYQGEILYTAREQEMEASVKLKRIEA